MAILKWAYAVIKDSVLWALHWLWAFVTAPFIACWKSVKASYEAAKKTPRLFLMLPKKIYDDVVKLQKVITEKVAYLEAESARWKRMFQLMKSPYSLLRAMGFSPQMATSLLVAGTAVSGGVVVNETILAEPSFAAGDTGIYTAPSDRPIFFEKSYNTLRVDLGSTPVKTLVIQDVTVGTAFTGSTLPANETTAVQVGGDSTALTYLIVGEMEFTKNRCDTLTLSDIDVHELVITYNASDGQSIAPSPGSARNQAILGGHGMAQDMQTKGGLYDRIWINAPTNGTDGKIDYLVLSNLFTKGGDCQLSRIKGGKLTISLNEIGGDSDLTTKAFQIATSVKASIITTEGNVEVSMTTPTAQTF